MIPYARQSISNADIKAVTNALISDFITQGSIVIKFESKVCKYVGVKHGVAVNSGTSALHMACLSLGLQSGDILWTSPITFVASANCGIYCNASVDFVDIDPDTWNISIEELKKKLLLASKSNKLPSILVVVHFSGLSCNMKEIKKLSKKYNFFVIEDGCHAFGGRYENDFIGSSRYSDISVFSFHAIKSITTGEGGIAVTNSKSIADRMMLLRSHGITRDTGNMINSMDVPWYYEQIDLGFNYRMTEFQAALGCSQLKRVDQFIVKRNRIVKLYYNLLKDLPLSMQVYDNKDYYSACHLFVVRLDLNKIDKTHEQIFKEMRVLGIGVNLHYIPIHMHPYYKNMGFKEGDFPKAESYYKETLSLPIYPDLSRKEVEFVSISLINVIKNK
jgi:UDP-4-amino-4,6-dideoxy-N-acetyl-beta-L-altrosamine transaminase